MTLPCYVGDGEIDANEMNRLQEREECMALMGEELIVSIRWLFLIYEMGVNETFYELYE